MRALESRCRCGPISRNPEPRTRRGVRITLLWASGRGFLEHGVFSTERAELLQTQQRVRADIDAARVRCISGSKMGSISGFLLLGAFGLTLATRRDGGSQFADALNLLTSAGAATLAGMPYIETDLVRRPSESALQNAKLYRVDYWRRVNVRDTQEVEAQLNAGYPGLTSPEAPSLGGLPEARAVVRSRPSMLPEAGSRVRAVRWGPREVEVP